MINVTRYNNAHTMVLRSNSCQIPSDERTHFTISGYYGPSLRLSQSEAQELFDCLHGQGFRPSWERCT